MQLFDFCPSFNIHNAPCLDKFDFIDGYMRKVDRPSNILKTSRGGAIFRPAIGMDGMTNTAELILDLQHAKEPRRELDKAIAQAIGFERKVVVLKDEKKAEWISPVDNLPSRVPYYTFQIDAAKSLAEGIKPKGAGGFTWANGRATARIGDGAIFTAATPALALCAAALSAKFHPVADVEPDQ